MKKIFLLFLLLCCCQLVWCQGTIRTVAGLHQSLHLQQTTFRLSLSPSLGIQTLRHGFYAGPIIHIKNFPSAEEKARLSGLESSYRFNLGKNPNAGYRWFLEANSRFQSFTEKWTSNHWNTSSGTYEDIKMENREYLWANYGGIGFAKQFYNRLELQAKFSAGYFFSSITPSGTTKEPIREEYDYRFYREQGAAFSVGIGINYYLH